MSIVKPDGEYLSMRCNDCGLEYTVKIPAGLDDNQLQATVNEIRCPECDPEADGLYDVERPQ